MGGVTVGQIAIFGGTFNPPHLGHVAMAEWASKRVEFDRILVMPAKLPPHKSGHLAAPEHSVQMCRLAFADLSGVSVCEAELALPGKSYTVNTLKSLTEQGVVQPTLIIGADSLVQFHAWRSFDEILKLAPLLVYQRAGIAPAVCRAAAEKLMAMGGRITLVDYTPPAISSSMVREEFAKAGHADALLPPTVADYIRAEGLYLEE